MTSKPSKKYKRRRNGGKKHGGRKKQNVKRHSPAAKLTKNAKPTSGE